MDVIILDRIQLYGKHGVFEEERRLGQRFFVSLELSLDLSKAGETDDLNLTVSYADVYELVKRIVEDESFKLIEALAETIATRLLDAYAKIQEVKVRVVKPHPPFDIVCDGVAVELRRRRRELGA